jgi:nucleotide-binding universal stress UspA family protein
MYKNMLIPTDGSELSDRAVQYGIALAKSVGAKIVVLTVSTPFHRRVSDLHAAEDTSVQYKKRTEEYIAKVLDAAADAAESAGVTCETMHIEHEHVYRAIIDTATSNQCDLIVMASHGRRGVAAIVLGSETTKVLTHCSIPVLVHRDSQLSAAQVLTALS